MLRSRVPNLCLLSLGDDEECGRVAETGGGGGAWKSRGAVEHAVARNMLRGSLGMYSRKYSIVCLKASPKVEHSCC